MDHFILKALMAGLLFAIASGPLGCFIVWRRLSFFGDTLAHASLTGLVIAMYWDVHPLFIMAPLSVLISLGLAQVSFQKLWTSDLSLSITSSGFLALGLLGINFIKGVRVDLNSYLFGDLLTVTSNDVLLLAGGVLGVIGVLYILWRPLLAITVNEDLAAVEGIQVPLVQRLFMVILALFVAISIKMIGILLMTALFILPAAAVRPLVTSPLQMALGASGMSGLLVILGILFSLEVDVPIAPLIVLLGIGLLGLTTFVQNLRKKKRNEKILK